VYRRGQCHAVIRLERIGIEPPDLRCANVSVNRHVEVAREFADAGYDRLALTNAGPDMNGFFDFFTKELAPELRR